MGRARRHARPLHRRVLGSARVTVSIALGIVLLGAGAAYGGYRYDLATSDRILPGVQIGGIDVGEMTRPQAIAAVDGDIDQRLGREIEVLARDQTWHVTASELGTTAAVEPLVDQALAMNEDYSWPSRVFRRLFDRPLDQDLELDVRQQGEDVDRFVESVAAEVNVDPKDASVEVVNGELVLDRPEVGWSLLQREAERSLRRAVTSGQSTVQLPVAKLTPEVTKDDLGYTIVIDLSELQLSLYDGLRLWKTYPVAAGSPAYPTPQGDWEIWDKRENPTWINPAPDGWGQGLPASIPGGPGSPLGTRALYLDAPGIRIHGTPASYSIGSYASHGCIRMLMPDVEELYDIVPIGTSVHIIA